MPKTIIISLGGSVIVPNDVDIKFLKNFKKTIESYIKKGHKFVLICGGGKTARKYQEAASDISMVDNLQLDWIGIMATRMNAHLVKTIFGRQAEDIIVHNPTKKIKFSNSILIAAGWKPGWSTDFDAILIAKQLKVKEIINMSNVDYVYDKDPRKYKNARAIKHIPWKSFRKLVGSSWRAGLNAPFDPIAAKEAEKLKLKVTVMGKNLDNLRNYLDGKDFRGSTIS